jgi:hypothetical protein
MSVAVLGGTGARVVTEIENIHGVSVVDPIISPFHRFRNRWKLLLEDFSTLLSDDHVFLLSAMGRAKVDVVQP